MGVSLGAVCPTARREEKTCTKTVPSRRLPSNCQAVEDTDEFERQEIRTYVRRVNM